MKPKKPVKLREFIPYEIGDWIIPKSQDPRKPLLFRCTAFSGNYVYGEHFGTKEVKRLAKVAFTKATDKDVSRVVAWRLKGGVW